jgi:hypothetical protein
MYDVFRAPKNAVMIRGYPKHNAPFLPPLRVSINIEFACSGRLRSITDAEELYLSYTSRVHVPDTLTPLHESDLDVIVAFDVNIVAVFIAISQLESTFADAAGGETGELGIDTINQRLVSDVESHHQSDVVS